MKVHCKFDELIDPKKLKNHPQNRNKHGNDQIERLAKLYDHHGIRHPIIVSQRSGFIVAGHGRKLAGIRAGLKEMPVVYQQFDSEESEYAFIQSDNAIALWAELDLSGIHEDLQDLEPFDLDLLGIHDFKLEPDPEDGLTDEDAVPEVKETSVKLGDIYQLGNHRLMCGDSTDKDTVSALMNGQNADMVFTDPPYNIAYVPEDRAIGGRAISDNKLGGIQNDKMSDDAFLEFLSSVNASIESSLVDGGAIYQCAPIGMNNLQYLLAWSQIGWHYSDGLVWLKNNHSISRKDYHPKHEIVHYGWRQGSHKWYGERNKFSVVEISRDNGTDYKHPTQKPVAVPEYFVNNSSQSKESVLDLFGGSGSTLIACEKTKRKCFMMELDPHYCQVIIDRWEQYTGKKAEKISSNDNS